MIKKYAIVASIAAQTFLTSSVATAQAQHFNIVTYVATVAQGNLDLIAQQQIVPLAASQVESAKSTFQDPLITAGLLQYDFTQQNQTATTVQLLVPLQFAGQRGTRIDVAKTGVLAAGQDLQDFARLVRADAGNAYVDGLHARLILDLKKRTLASLEKLVSVNEQRLKAGDVGEVILVQSRVEAHQFRAQVMNAEGDVRAADLRMIQLLGNLAVPWTQSLELDGDLNAAADKTFDPAALVAQALQTRPDVRAAQHRVDQAHQAVSLARRNRWFDVAIGATWQHNFVLTGPNALGVSDFIGATLTLPIPFTKIWTGEIDGAHAVEDQNAIALRSVGMRVEMEVRRAITLYDAAAARVKMYTGGGVLHDADAVLDKTLFNYQRGGASLVEVLVAQRTVNDVYLAYYEALADSAHALIAVQQALGVWDVNL